MTLFIVTQAKYKDNIDTVAMISNMCHQNDNFSLYGCFLGSIKVVCRHLLAPKDRHLVAPCPRNEIQSVSFHICFAVLIDVFPSIFSLFRL